MKNDFLQSVIHWLLVAIGFLSALSGLGWVVHLVPGRIGLVLGSLFALIVSAERFLILVEKILAGKIKVEEVTDELVKDGEDIANGTQKLAKAAEPFIKNAPVK